MCFIYEKFITKKNFNNNWNAPRVKSIKYIFSELFFVSLQFQTHDDNDDEQEVKIKRKIRFLRRKC